MFRNLALGGGLILLCLMCYPLVLSLGRRLAGASRKVWEEAEPADDDTPESQE